MRSLFAAVLAGAVLVACSSGPDSSETSECTVPFDGVAVDTAKELVITDDSVLHDDRAMNRSDGTWSFRARMRELAPSGVTPAQATYEWLASYGRLQRINGFDVAPRTEVNRLVLCPWMKRTPANACNEDCSTCAANELDLAESPFRLVAIANRTDTALTNSDYAGRAQARLVYTLVDGAADDDASKPMRMSVIFEYLQPESDEALPKIARTWHQLSTFPTFDEPYKAKLAEIMGAITTPGSSPDRPLGNSIGQVRTNEREFDWQWDMRQFSLRETGLELVSPANTPDPTVNDSPELVEFLNTNAQAILANKHVLPARLLGGSVGLFTRWVAGTVPSDVLTEFNRNTCNGCHQNAPTGFNFHIAQGPDGKIVLSDFLLQSAIPQRLKLQNSLLCDR